MSEQDFNGHGLTIIMPSIQFVSQDLGCYDSPILCAKVGTDVSIQLEDELTRPS